MKKRLMVGVMAGGLLAAMLPGVASATPGNPDIGNTGQCVSQGLIDRAADPNVANGPGVYHVDKPDLNSGSLNGAAASQGRNPFLLARFCY